MNTTHDTPNTPNSSIAEIVTNNYAKIKAIREKGIDPFPHRFKPTHTMAEAAKLTPEAPATVAGRMVLMRVMGKATFAHL